MHPKLSVCIPVYNSEPYLSFCLESVANQTFSDYEIVLVSDGSEGKNEQGQNCKQIVKSFCKNHKKIKVNFIQNSKNLGTLETRRTLIFKSKGQFIFFLDSDDFIHPDALESVYLAAIENNAEIVQGKILSGSFPENSISGFLESFEVAQKQKLTAIHIGVLENREIFTNIFIEKKVASCLCGKLISRELLLNAYDKIPFAKLSLQEDLLVMFFASLQKNKYIGLDTVIYYYRLTSGMTSGKTINELATWELHCSVASVYHIILTFINENKDLFTELETAFFQQLTRLAVRFSLSSLHTQVTPSLRPQARQMLNEYWGKGLVDRIENQMKEEMKNKSFEK